MGALLLLLAGLSAQDPVRVHARLADDAIRAGETTVLRVDVETDGPRARIERITRLPPGIELVSTRDYDQRQFSLPGGTRRFISREYVLRARAQGVYRIPAIDVEVGTRRYATASQLLTVDAPAPRALGERIEGPAGEVMLRAWVDADTVFVGEQVTLRADAMFSQAARLRLRRAPEYEPPSPSGFWIQDLPDHRNPVARTIDGEIYEVQSFRRAFFPLSAGEFQIPSARLEYEMRRGLLYAPETFEVTTDEIPLVVLPVPSPDQPASFTGAVGRYEMRGWLEPAQVPAGEAAVLTVEVEGAGNVKALPPPALPDMEAIEVFPPSEEAETEIVGDEVRGRKRFSWVLIPRETGSQQIPAIRYAYFDPAAGGYETLEVPGMTLGVTPGLASGDAPATATLRYLKLEPEGPAGLGWVRSPWFAFAQLGPLLLLAGAVAVRRRGTRGTTVSRGALRRRRKALMRDLEAGVASDDPGFFGTAEAESRVWIAERLAIQPRDAGRATALTAAGVPTTIAAGLAATFDRLASARYAPAPPGRARRREILLALDELLDRLDREAPLPKRSGAAGPAGGASRAGAGPAATALLFGLGLAAATVAAPASASAQGGADEVFRAGLDAFEAGRFDEAAGAFDRYVDRHPDDTAGWYNLGTAYHRAGHSGFAIWAWLHAAGLDPRDEDTRHNLRVAGAEPELVARIAPPLPLRTSEMLLLASVAWLAAAAGLAWWVVRRRGWSAVLGSIALLLALGLASAAALSTGGAETLIVLDPATLRAGPTLGGETITRLAPGAGLEPVASHGDWLRVRTLNGREGWIERRSTGAL